MADLSSVLANIPGLGGYLAQQQHRQGQQDDEMGRNLQRMKLADVLKGQQREQKMRDILMQSGGDPAKASQALLGAGYPEEAAKIQGMVTKPTKTWTQGSQFNPETGTEEKFLYDAASADPQSTMIPVGGAKKEKAEKPERLPDFAQLMVIEKKYRDSGDTVSANRIAEYIKGLNKTEPIGEKPSDRLAREKFEWEKSHYGQEKPLTQQQRYKNEAQKLKDTTAVEITKRTTSSMIDEIDKLIGNEEKGVPEHPGLKGSVGYIDAASWMPPITKAQADAQALIKGLLAKTSVEGLQSIRKEGSAPGSITEKEWPIFQNYLKTIDPKQSYPQFVQQLKDLRQMSNEYRDSAIRNYEQRYVEQENQNVDPVIPPEQPNQQPEVHNSLPSAKDYAGKIAIDTLTGKRYKSNGSTWIKQAD